MLFLWQITLDENGRMAKMEEACPIRLLNHARKVLASRLGRLPDVIRSDWPLECKVCLLAEVPPGANLVMADDGTAIIEEEWSNRQVGSEA